MTGMKKWLGALAIGVTMMTGFSFGSFAYSVTGGIDSVKIDPETRETIHIGFHTEPKDMIGTDGKIYVFEIKPYQNSLMTRHDPVGQAETGAGQSITIPLDAGPGEKRLYSSFILAVNTGNHYQPISGRHYVTNPEVLAPNQEPAKNAGKKGLRADPNLLDDALKLNIKHAGVDIPTSRFFGKGISYSYEGRTFKINSELINQLDAEVQRLTDSGVTVTGILLNAWNEVTPELNRPGIARLPAEKAAYYTFNVETEDGFRAVKAMASFLATRYNGKNGHGKITNWVVGNEIDNQYWNYTGDFEVSTYTHIFQQSFRVFYTAIKSQSANDTIMFSLDHFWNTYPEAAPVQKYKGREVLESFNAWDKEEGATSWGLALHPYPDPINDPVFWNDDKKGRAVDSIDSPIINFKNLHVITNFMQQSAMRTPDGKVRKIFLTEEGFSSITNGKDSSMQQAAAVAYSYYIVDNNPYITAYLMSRQEDNASEVAAGLAFGLETVNGNNIQHKPAWDVFRVIDDPSASLPASDFAKEIIGIKEWDQVIPGFHAPK